MIIASPPSILHEQVKVKMTVFPQGNGKLKPIELPAE